MLVIVCYLSVADEGVGLPPFRADLVLRSNLLGGSLFIYCLFSPQYGKVTNDQLCMVQRTSNLRIVQVTLTRLGKKKRILANNRGDTIYDAVQDQPYILVPKTSEVVLEW